MRTPGRAHPCRALAAPDIQRGFERLPIALKVLWVILASVVGINVVVWLIASVTTVSFMYPWPLWVAGPPGAALFAVSASVQALRRSHRRQLPPVGSAASG
jgi:hypothetical protein